VFEDKSTFFKTMQKWKNKKIETRFIFSINFLPYISVAELYDFDAAPAPVPTPATAMFRLRTSTYIVQNSKFYIFYGTPAAAPVKKDAPPHIICNTVSKR
jgi:hypothetical protein